MMETLPGPETARKATVSQVYRSVLDVGLQATQDAAAVSGARGSVNVVDRNSRSGGDCQAHQLICPVEFVEVATGVDQGVVLRL